MLGLKKYRADTLKRKFSSDGKKSVIRRFRMFAILSTMFLLTALIYLVCFAGKPIIIPQVHPNRVVNFKLTSGIDFSYVSDLLTKAKRDRVAERIAPVYKVNETQLVSAENKIREFAELLNAEQEEYDSLKKENKENLPRFFDKLSNDIRLKTSLAVSPTDISIIFEHTNLKNRSTMLSQVKYNLMSILRAGVFADDDKIFSQTSISDITGLKTSEIRRESRARSDFLRKAKHLGFDDALTMAFYRALNQEIHPNISYNAEETQKRRAEASAKVEPVKVKIRSGEDIVDPESMSALIQQERMRAYQKALSQERGEDRISKTNTVQELMISFLLVISATLFLSVSRLARNKHPKTIAIFCILLLLNLGLARVIVHLTNTEFFNSNLTYLQLLLFATPIMLGPMIQVLLFGAYTGFVMALMICALTSVMLSQGISYFLLFLAAALLAIYFCNGATSRYRVMLGGLFYGAFVAVFAIILGRAWGISWEIYLRQATIALLSGGFTGILTITILPMMERLFNRYSNITLLDFADLNRPILRKLQLVAPGTYHHSVMVSHLAESAAMAVGANALVCRVGALYHDIGKIYKPEFFTENQRDKNPHDDRNPSMSSLIIKSHVKEGADLAIMERLPKQVVDAINQHHGTSIIQYFYNKAMSLAENKDLRDPEQALRDAGIEEDTYRHEGVKPQTIENAIIMIADSCEAASRSLQRPTQHGVEELVNNITRAKMNDGQLDECPITIKQLAKIKASFVFSMLNMLHTRVSYDNNKK